MPMTRAAVARISALVLVLAAIGNCAKPASAHDAKQTLTITAHLCPDGYTGADYAADCAAPIVGGRFRVWPTTVTTDTGGRASLEIGDRTPGEIVIVQEIDAKAGPIVSCMADGKRLDAGVVMGTGASWAPISVLAPATSDIVCAFYYSNDMSFGLNRPASDRPNVSESVFSLRCDADPGRIADPGGSSFPPTGCRLEAGVTLSAATGGAVALGSCVTGANGRCTLHLPAQGAVILHAAAASIPTGYRLIANPVLLRATQAPFGIVLIPVGSAERPSGPASLTVHSRVCPPGYAGSAYDHDCHATVPDYAQTIFLIGQNGGVDATSAEIDPEGNVIFSALAAERSTLIPALPSTIAGTHVFCSRDAAPGVEFSSQTTFTAVAVSKTEIDLSQGDAVTCDLFAIPAAP